MKKLSLLILILLFSCEDNGLVPSYGCIDGYALNTDPNAIVDDGSCIYDYAYTWTNDIVHILATCMDCHHELTNDYSSLEGSGFIDGDYNPDTNEMFRRINLDSNNPDFMPQGLDPLNEDNIEKIRVWLLEGVPE